MAKTNYNKMSKKNTVEDVPVVESGSLDIEQITVDVETPVIEKEPEAVSAKKCKYGIVNGCAKLNMRVAPSVNAEIRGTLDLGAKVTILGEEGDFYKVGNPEDPDYCMKKYISVK